MYDYEIVHRRLPPAISRGRQLLSLKHHFLLRGGPQHWITVSAVSEGFQPFLPNYYWTSRKHPDMQRLMHKSMLSAMLLD